MRKPKIFNIVFENVLREFFRCKIKTDETREK